MESLAQELIQTIINVINVPLVFGIVVVIEILKKLIIFKNKKYWILGNIIFGFIASFLTIAPFSIRLFIIQGFVYIAGCELIYRAYQLAIKLWKKNKGKK